MGTLKEIEYQEAVLQALLGHNLFPASVICTYALDHSGILAVTFYMRTDLDELLDFLDYKSQCDRSGYLVLAENNTVILSGIGLVNLYTRL